MINDILSQTVSDLDRYLCDPEWADTYRGELRDRIARFRDEADALRAVLDSDPIEDLQEPEAAKTTWVDDMMAAETAFDLHTPRFSKKDLKQRGWSDAMIDELLGPPDWTQPNPHYASAAPMRCWRQDRVLMVESTQAFQDRARSASMIPAASLDSKRRRPT